MTGLSYALLESKHSQHSTGHVLQHEGTLARLLAITKLCLQWTYAYLAAAGQGLVGCYAAARQQQHWRAKQQDASTYTSLYKRSSSSSAATVQQ
jgi:hypothetical protein